MSESNDTAVALNVRLKPSVLVSMREARQGKAKSK